MPNGFNPANVDRLDPAAREHIQRRIDLLGPAYRLFYNEPVGVVRGKGAYLYDKDGNEYRMPITTWCRWGIAIRALSPRSLNR